MVVKKEKDILQHLLGIERAASELVLSAQEEADRRSEESAQALRATFQKQYEAASKEIQARLATERQDFLRNREEELNQFKKDLEGEEWQRERFNALCQKLFFEER